MIEAEVVSAGQIDYVYAVVEEENCIVLYVGFNFSGMEFVGEMGDDDPAIGHSVFFGRGASIIVKGLPFLSSCAVETTKDCAIVTFIPRGYFENGRLLWEAPEDDPGTLIV